MKEPTQGSPLVCVSLYKHTRTGPMTPPTIYTFGFGYELDTPLLVEIGTLAKGTLVHLLT
jgi:hypothetical protein